MGYNLSNAESEWLKIAHEQNGHDASSLAQGGLKENEKFPPCYLLMGDSCIITNSPLGGYGELVPICLSKKLFLNYSFGCFACEVVKDIPNPQFANHLILKCSWAKNDFENEVSYFDVTDRFVYDTLK